MPTVLPRLARRARPQLDALADRLVAGIEAQTEDYRLSVRLSRAELWQACRHNIAVHLDALEGGEDTGFAEAAMATGRARAEGDVPLEALLQAYRIGGRIICEALIETATPREERPLLAELPGLWALVDRSSSLVTRGYVEAQRRSAPSAAHRRALLVEALLGGGLDGPGARMAAAEAGLPVTGEWAAVCVSDWPQDRPAPGRVLADGGVTSAWRSAGSDHVGVVVTDRRDVAALLSHPSARCAVGLTTPRLEELPGSLRLARLLRDALAPGEAVSVDQALPRVLLAAAPDVALLLRDRVLGPLRGIADEERAELLATARAYAAGGCSASAAAAALGCHRNTVAQRLRRLTALTGRPLDSEYLLELQLCPDAGPA